MNDQPVETSSPAPNMVELLSQSEFGFQQPQRGDIRKGTVVWVGPNEIVVDIGVKREGVVNARDLERLSPEELSAIAVGSEIPVYIVKPEDQDGNLIVSIYLAQIETAWQEAKEYQASQKIIEEKVNGFNKGGLVVPFGKLRGFVPASQVVGLPRQLPDEERIQRLSQQVGRPIVVQIIEVDRKRKRLVMSEQSAQRGWRDQQRQRLMETLIEGQVTHGVVRSLANFGAFVDLGGVDGLVHISELSWQPIKHPSQVVHVGDEVDVHVLKLDRAQGKIGLSLKRLQPDPWSVIESQFAVGQRVAGTITNLADFGAFVRLENGIEGLIHVSELSDVDIQHPSEVVQRGKHYLLEIIKIDPDRHRIGLSLRRVPAPEQAAWNAAQVAEQSAPAPDELAPQPSAEAPSEPPPAEAIGNDSAE
jgi:small subunit ribosomal protein S1